MTASPPSEESAQTKAEGDSMRRAVTQEIAAALSSAETQPLGEERWAQMYEKLWQENERLSERNETRIASLIDAHQALSSLYQPWRLSSSYSLSLSSYVGTLLEGCGDFMR